MSIQRVPTFLQNASHSAAIFRQSASAAFATGGILSAGELSLSQQGTPNMSVILGAGRAKVVGNSVSPPSGLSFTTQAMYDTLNDAPLTLTVAAADATNPRIDVPYIQVQDSFYSGAANQAIAGIVTGTPAPTPIAPSIPSNAIGLPVIAVAANATSIVNANIGSQASLASLLGGKPGTVQVSPVSVGGTGASFNSAGTIVLTNATSVDINQCFTAAYANFHIVFDLRFASAATPSFVFRAAGSPVATGYDNHIHYFTGTGTTSAIGAESTNATFHTLTVTAAVAQSGSMDIFGPMKPILKQIQSHVSAYTGSAVPIVTMSDSGQRSTSTSDGFGISWGGTVLATGTITIYGWNN